MPCTEEYLLIGFFRRKKYKKTSLSNLTLAVHPIVKSVDLWSLFRGHAILYLLSFSSNYSKTRKPKTPRLQCMARSSLAISLAHLHGLSFAAAKYPRTSGLNLPNPILQLSETSV